LNLIQDLPKSSYRRMGKIIFSSMHIHTHNNQLSLR